MEIGKTAASELVQKQIQKQAAVMRLERGAVQVAVQVEDAAEDGDAAEEHQHGMHQQQERRGDRPWFL